MDFCRDQLDQVPLMCMANCKQMNVIMAHVSKLTILSLVVQKIKHYSFTHNIYH